MDFLNDVVLKRYACKKFDGKTVPEEKIAKLKEIIRHSASSFGLQPWKIKVITDKETKEKLSPASWNQPQITSCSHLFVICADTEIVPLIEKYENLVVAGGTPPEQAKKLADMMRSFEQGMPPEAKRAWTQKQCYIAMGNALNGAAALGLDTCPMEGFDPKQYSEILALPQNLVPTLVVPVGYAADTPHKKIRFEEKEIFF